MKKAVAILLMATTASAFAWGPREQGIVTGIAGTLIYQHITEPRHQPPVVVQPAPQYQPAPVYVHPAPQPHYRRQEQGAPIVVYPGSRCTRAYHYSIQGQLMYQSVECD